MIFSRFKRMLFFFVAEGYLQGAIAIGLLRFNLCYNTGTGFDDRASRLAAGRIEDGGHPNFFTNDSFHVAYGCSRKVVQDKRLERASSILVHHRPFPESNAQFWGSTGDKQTSKGLFICFGAWLNFFKSPCLTFI